MTKRPRGWTIRGYLLAFVSSALVANAVLGERGAIEMARARRDYRAAAESIGALRAENVKLRTEARLLRTDRRTIESIARRDLGLAAPDERLIIIRDISGR